MAVEQKKSMYEKKIEKSYELDDIIKGDLKFYSLAHLIYYFKKIEGVELSNATFSRRLHEMPNATKICVANKVEYFAIDNRQLYDLSYKINHKNNYISVRRLKRKNPRIDLLQFDRENNTDYVSLMLVDIEKQIIDAYFDNNNDNNYVKIENEPFNDENCLNENHKHEEYKRIYEAKAIVKFWRVQGFEVEHIKNGQNSYLKISW